MIDEMYDTFINLYTLFDVTLGKFYPAKEKNKIFTDLSRIFMINDSDFLKGVFEAMENPYIQGAVDRERYYLLCRAIAFKPDAISETEKQICIKKKDAILIYEQFFSEHEPTSLGEALSLLYIASDSGKTNCMALLAFLQATGTLVRKKTNHAIKLINDLACWNHIGGIMMGLSFVDNDNKEYYCNHLYAALSKNIQIDAAEFIRDNIDATFDSHNASLALELERAFDRGREKRDSISHIKLKMMKSVVFDDETKKKIIMSNMNNGDIEKMPINIDKRNKITIEYATLVEKLEKNSGEQYIGIANNLALINTNTLKYKPLLIICKDSVILRKAERLLKSVFTKNPVSVLDFKNLSNCVFSRSLDNIVISTLDKNTDAGTVIFMENVDEIPKKDVDDFAILLRRSNLEKYKLMYSDIMLNISGFIPILFSTTRPCDEIYDECEVVELLRLSNEEKEDYLLDVVESMTEELSLEDAPVITSEGKYRLLEFDPERIYDVVLRCCQMSIHRGEKIVISEESIKELTAKSLQSENHTWKRY